jgi:hypothetical protein
MRSPLGVALRLLSALKASFLPYFLAFALSGDTRRALGWESYPLPMGCKERESQSKTVS